MKIKILTWNMNYWQKKAVHKQAWKYLNDTLKPDIALLQEMVPYTKHFGFIGTGATYPIGMLESQTILWREIGGKRKWGSGITTRGLPIREVPIHTNYQGSLIVGEVLLPDDSLLTLISLYAMLENGYSITSLHRMFSDLTLLLDGKMGKRLIVLGGDFNASLQWDKQQHGESHRLMFERLENFGLINCLNMFHDNHIQTWRNEGRSVPWQLDYIFVSKNLRKSMASCEVISNEAIFGLSDHNPVIIELVF